VLHRLELDQNIYQGRLVLADAQTQKIDRQIPFEIAKGTSIGIAFDFALQTNPNYIFEFKPLKISLR
jgi:hypothetical protein